ncbi:MAG: GNAT family N-acetyltransferase [Burkholderiaceae bacterium]|nr:GNAT family N-acetyltransferase [Burkholderiaceae bacterium]
MSGNEAEAADSAGEAPSGEPPQWLAGPAQARAGAELYIRPLGRDDVARERRFLEGLSPESLRQRLLGAVTDASDTMLAHLVEPGWPARLALAVVRRDSCAVGVGGEEGAGDEEILGVARFDAGERGGVAEFGIVIADAWQRKGLGHALFERLVRAARAAGYRELVGITFADNRGMVELARSHGFEVGPEPGERGLRRLTLRL